jgi:WD40 repeat protein
MGRLLLACVLGCAIFALVAWHFDLLTPEESKQTSTVHGNIVKPAADLGAGLYTPVKVQAPLGMLPVRRVDPIVVLGTMAVIDRPDIAAQIAGAILFIGDEVPEGALQAAGAAAFLAEPFDFTTVNHGSYLSIKPFRRLYEGQIVYQDQMLAMVDPAKALGEVEMKQAKVIAAKADSNGAKSIADEADNKFLTAEQVDRKHAGTAEDLRSARLTRDKMGFDFTAKFEAWRQSLTEEKMSRIVYKQHEILNKNPGPRSVIQKIYKQRGEAVRELEPVIQVYSLDRLKAEAQIDDNFARRALDGARVTLEPSLVDSPPKTYSGHTSTVTCLAVTNSATDPLIVSGSDDKTVLVWKRFVQGYDRKFDHPDAVKSLVCSPVGSSANLVLTGCGDGSIRLFDLDAKDADKALVKSAGETGSAVTALAFSPDGKHFASGSSDGTLALWATATVTRLYVFDESHGVTDAHHGAITSLHFTPQCKLVSASADNTLRVWSLMEKGAALDYAPLTGRSGTVSHVDVSSDGRFMLFDQGKTLHVKAVADGRLINTYQNPGGVIPFETLALFSPDASLLLTAGASDGRLQLWYLPNEAARGYEVRQFATRERVPASCAAFAPRTDYHNEGSFAVSANRDGQIYLWPLPSRADAENHQIRDKRLRLPNSGLNSTRQVSIEVEVDNPSSPQYPKGRLEPGRPVTIVIE